MAHWTDTATDDELNERLPELWRGLHWALDRHIEAHGWGSDLIVALLRATPPLPPRQPPQHWWEAADGLEAERMVRALPPSHPDIYRWWAAKDTVDALIDQATAEVEAEDREARLAAWDTFEHERAQWIAENGGPPNARRTRGRGR